MQQILKPFVNGQFTESIIWAGDCVMGALLLCANAALLVKFVRR